MAERTLRSCEIALATFTLNISLRYFSSAVSITLTFLNTFPKAKINRFRDFCSYGYPLIPYQRMIPPFDLIRSSCDPFSTSRPFSSTYILSALRTVRKPVSDHDGCPVTSNVGEVQPVSRLHSIYPRWTSPRQVSV